MWRHVERKLNLIREDWSVIRCIFISRSLFVLKFLLDWSNFKVYARKSINIHIFILSFLLVCVNYWSVKRVFQVLMLIAFALKDVVLNICVIRRSIFVSKISSDSKSCDMPSAKLLIEGVYNLFTNLSELSNSEWKTKLVSKFWQSQEMMTHVLDQRWHFSASIKVKNSHSA